jgi:hypothetical protein
MDCYKTIKGAKTHRIVAPVKKKKIKRNTNEAQIRDSTGRKSYVLSFHVLTTWKSTQQFALNIMHRR